MPGVPERSAAAPQIAPQIASQIAPQIAPQQVAGRLTNRRANPCPGFCAALALVIMLVGLQAPALAQVSVLEKEIKALPASERARLASALGDAAGGVTLSGLGKPGMPLQAAKSSAPQAGSPAGQPPRKQAASVLVRSLKPGQRFGLGFFDAEVSSFEPVDNAPIPADYRLGPGDSLNVMLVGSESAQFEVVVDREGSIIFPKLGRLRVASLSFAQVSELIESRIAEQLIGVTPIISTGRLRAINIFVVGEVKVPGSRSMSALSRVSNALYAAGGLTEIGALRRIEVKREGETVVEFDAYDLLLKGDARSDIRLLDGDVIFVPPVGSMAEIWGEVRRPAVYELKGRTLLGDLLSMAGGLTARAQFREAIVERQESDGLPKVYSTALDAKAEQHYEIRRGDRVRVLGNADRFANRVILRGAVQHPGVFGFEEGMRVSDLIDNIEQDLVENVDYDYSLIVSEDVRTGEINVRNFSIRAIINEPGGPGDLLLRPRDQLLFFNNLASSLGESDAGRIEKQLAQDDQVDESAEPIEQLHARKVLLKAVIARLQSQATPDEPARIVSISGAVYGPGQYPLSRKMTVRELLRAAGGLRDDAYVWEAELRRVRVNEEGAASIQSQLLNLNADNEGLGFQLHSRDVLQIRRIPDFRPRNRISINGEVRFPGSYVISAEETVADVINRAGGLTREAFADGAVFTRAQLRAQEAEEVKRFINELRRNFASATLTLEQSSGTVAELEALITVLRENNLVGRMIIDLPRILSGHTPSDFVLQNGDELRIPKQVNTVTVIGEVRRPGSYRFQAELSIKDYVATSAGMTRRADKKAIYILRANGEIIPFEGALWSFNLRTHAPKSGDTIVVPINTSYRDTLAFWETLTRIASQTGFAAITLGRGINNW